MIREITELNLPQYATLSQATCTLQDMDDKNITAKIKIDGTIAPDFSFDWEIAFKGEKYIMPLRKPQASKEYSSRKSTVELTFQHWAIYQLKRWFFFTIQALDAGTAVPDKYIADVSLNLVDFCELFNRVLYYYYGDSITLDLNPEWQSDVETTTVEISHSTLWGVLQKYYELWSVRWQIEPHTDNDNTKQGGEKYVIRVGYPTTEVSHIFQYGFDGGLLKFERQVQSDDIRNMLIGRGGDQNLPYRYFKDVDPDNPTFAADPDWIPELRNIYFDKLRGKTFRDYVKGWKTNPNRQLTETDGTAITPYPHDDTVEPIAVEPYDEEYAKTSWAYVLGHTDERFNPVEYVADKYEVNDNGEVVITAGSSIALYGILMGGLDDNDDIYPTIQGVELDGIGRADEAIYVEQVTSDDVTSRVTSDAVESTMDDTAKVIRVKKNESQDFEIIGPEFVVAPDKKANFSAVVSVSGRTDELEDISSGYFVIESQKFTIVNKYSGEEYTATNFPEGTYYYKLECTVQNNYPDKDYSRVMVTVSSARVTMASVSGDDDLFGRTFDILIKNIWQTEKRANETEEDYARRVWEPILGDHLGSEAAIAFSSGLLSTSEDYDFLLTKIPVHEEQLCEWETAENGKLVKHSYMSHWRITLEKSDADYDATGLYLPSTKTQGKAGDHFYFIGIDLPHQYVLWAESYLDDDKYSELDEVKDIKPTYVVSLDKNRVNQVGEDGTSKLIDSLTVGASVRIADSRFITDTPTETLYLQAITYTYNEPSSESAALLPDVEVTLSDEVESSTNAVTTIQSDISTIYSRLGSISNIEQIVKIVCDKLYLRKDGIEELSLSPTQFAGKITSSDFRQGSVAGVGWGVYRDGDGNTVIEADKYVARQEFSVNNLVVNQISVMGGKEISSAAQMTVTNVLLTDDGYYCYFDQKQGSVVNLFMIDDVAMSQRFDAENLQLKFYKRRVIGVGVDYILLSTTDVNGSGIPQVGDVICHYGNYSNSERQYVKVRDVIGGGYEAYISNLNSVTSTGDEYYFVGRQSGTNPRLFIGDRLNDFMEWQDGKLTIKGDISIQSTINGENISDVIGDDYLRKALENDTDISGGLIQTTAIRFGDKNSLGEFTTRAGSSGTYSEDEVGGGLAFFAGGDRVDPEDDTVTDKTPSTFGVRMDGSVYAANNTVRIKQNSLEIGDKIQVSEDGLFMLGPGGEERLRIAADSLEDGNAYLDVVDFDVSHVLDTQRGYFTLSATYDGSMLDEASNQIAKTILLGGLPTNTTVTLNASFKVLIPNESANITDFAPEPWPTNYPNFTVQLLKDSTVVTSESQRCKFEDYGSIVNPDNAAEAIGGFFATVAFTLSFRVNTSGTYQIKLNVNETTSADGARLANIPVFWWVNLTGKVKTDFANVTTIAKNGFSSIWNKTVCYVGDGSIMLHVGSCGIRVGAAGVFINRGDGNGYVAL
jgi:hypothetical protein